MATPAGFRGQELSEDQGPAPTGILRTKGPRPTDMRRQLSREASSSSSSLLETQPGGQRIGAYGEVGTTSNATEMKSTDEQEDPGRPRAPLLGWLRNKRERVLTCSAHAREKLQRFFFFLSKTIKISLEGKNGEGFI